MNTIDHVKIEGFWGEENVALQFDDQQNFLIGRNGSGKTTAINLIAAALSADFRTLDRISFDKITIKLSEVGGRRKPVVVIQKKPNSRLPFPHIEYSIRDATSDDPVIYSLDEFEEQAVFRNFNASSGRLRAHQMRHPQALSITDHLTKLVNVSWLSVHRHTGRRRPTDERSWDSTVDQKLDELTNSLVRYFSQLTEGATSLLEQFQKNIFLSLLSDQTEADFTRRLRKFDVEKEREAIVEIFEEYQLKEKDYIKKVDRHFRHIKEEMGKFSGSEPISFSGIAALTGTVKINALAEDWRQLRAKRLEIYKPRDNFLNILNKLVLRKEFFVKENNELGIKTQSGREYSIDQLSSGEKQLVIVLGEALLQREKSWIYIADEPELSLHVTWQEALVRNLKSLNPAAQIIFATHSPDIVSTYTNFTINMERCLS